jgi:hypothetical protein
MITPPGEGEGDGPVDPPGDPPLEELPLLELLPEELEPLEPLRKVERMPERRLVCCAAIEAEALATGAPAGWLLVVAWGAGRAVALVRKNSQ